MFQNKVTPNTRVNRHYTFPSSKLLRHGLPAKHAVRGSTIMLSEFTSCPVLITKNFVSPVNLSVYTCPGELPQKLATKLFFQYRTLGNRLRFRRMPRCQCSIIIDGCLSTLVHDRSHTMARCEAGKT